MHNSDAAIAKWIKERDISLDGTVTFSEFVASFGALMQPETDADDFLQRDPKTGEYILNSSVSNFSEMVKKALRKDASKGKNGKLAPASHHHSGGHLARRLQLRLGYLRFSIIAS